MKINGSFVGAILLGLLGALSAPQALGDETSEVGLTNRITSPDGAMVFLLEQDPSTGTLAWSVHRDGRPIVTRGALGLELAGTGVVASKGPVSVVGEQEIATSWKPPYGERSLVEDKCREKTLGIGGGDAGGPEVRLQVRAYDEGIAFRYLLSRAGTFTVASEKTSFPLPADAAAWISRTAQSKIARQSVGRIKGVVERPLTLELAPDLFAALGEAGLVDGSRMKFSKSAGTTLSARLDGPVTCTDTFTSAWRYVRAAGSPGALLEGNGFMLNLNAPNRIGDTSWLRPGKVLREVTLTNQGAKACVDYAASHGLQYIMFDAGWYCAENDQRSDATTVTVDPKRSPGPLDLQEVIAYAKKKKIGVILYVNRRALEKQLDQLLPLYQQWGVAGIKFGFVNVGSQQATKWLHDAIAQCAKHRLMVDVHDEYRMTGVERTLPNFMTAEGVRGDEESPKNEEVLATLFTRCLAGPADQTNCYFASRVKGMGSHASQLAKLVCVYSPWQSVFWYDRPATSPTAGKAGGGVSVLQDVPEIGFLERVPTVWDETRVPDGNPSSHAVVARRSGDVWFVGALNGTKAREFKIPLDFLSPGKKYRLELFSDDPSVATPTQVRVESKVVDSRAVIKHAVAMRGGLAAILTPEPVAAKPAAAPRTAADAVTPKLFKRYRHNEFMKRKAAGPIGLLFLGDSITDWWPRNGKDSWAKFAPHDPADFAVAAMRTEGLLWNITHGELDGLNPKVTVVLIGVNNILQCPDEKPEWVAAGIRKVVATVREKMPETKVLLMAIFPARNPATHPARARIAAVNRLIADLDDGKQVRFLDLGAKFLDAEGNVSKALTRDGLHPNAKGYEIWYQSIQPLLKEMMGN